jgi:glycosyltransferase involved in cell wall biosynthesis
VEQPLNELKRFGVDFNCIIDIPTNPFGNSLQEVVSLCAQYDLIIIQRSTNLGLMATVKSACDLLRKPVIFETDDDYLHIPIGNPNYKHLSTREFIEQYITILKTADAVTVSTEELRKIVYPYNKNIKVLPNNMSTVYCGEWGGVHRAYLKGFPDEEGRLNVEPAFRMNANLMRVPAWIDQKHIDAKTEKVIKTVPKKLIRIGYSGTPTHVQDFETIRHKLDELVDKYKKDVILVFIGDKHFPSVMKSSKTSIVHLGITEYNRYIYHLSNLDIGLAPLYPNLFNMSKSPIKALEYAAWGVPAVLPNFVTYNREFTHRKNAMFYNNPRDFYDALEELVLNDELREKLGRGARDHLQQNRLEKNYARERLEFYQAVISSKPRLKIFKPNRSEVNETIRI